MRKYYSVIAFWENNYAQDSNLLDSKFVVDVDLGLCGRSNYEKVCLISRKRDSVMILRPSLIVSILTKILIVRKYFQKKKGKISWFEKLEG